MQCLSGFELYSRWVPLYFGSKPRIGEVKTSIDNTTGQRSLFLDSSTFFFQLDSHFFFDSNFKISTRFFSFLNIYFANLESYFLLHSMYFTSFHLSTMFSKCFYNRYNFVRNGTPYQRALASKNSPRIVKRR